MRLACRLCSEGSWSRRRRAGERRGGWRGQQGEMALLHNRWRLCMSDANPPSGSSGCPSLGGRQRAFSPAAPKASGVSCLQGEGRVDAFPAASQFHFVWQRWWLQFIASERLKSLLELLCLPKGYRMSAETLTLQTPWWSPIPSPGGRRRGLRVPEQHVDR